MRTINIIWDVDDEEDLENLPEVIDIPDDFDADDIDEISDYISDVTGYCHCGFDLSENEGGSYIEEVCRVHA